MANRNKRTAKKYENSKDEADYKQSKPNRRWSKDEKSKGRNDVSWYAPDIQILNDAGRWPYSRPVGTPLGRDSLLHLVDTNDDAVPGICAAHVMITYGDSKNGQSALNVAANAMYSYIRHANSGSRNYDTPDLMIYIGAVDSIYSFVTWCTRIYATIPMFADMNKYLPDEIARLQGVDLDDIRENMANWRAKFNSLLMKIGTLLVPDSLPIFRRHAMLFQNYYSEGPSIKDQMYFYTLANVYKFQKDSSGAGMLKYVNIRDYVNPNTNLLGAKEILTILEDLITPIFNDEDFNIMSGDILKAYEGKIMKLLLLPDLITQVPINNVVVLEQFKNIRSCGGVVSTSSTLLDITQDSNKEYLLVNTNGLPIGLKFGFISINPNMTATYPDEVAAMEDQWSRNLILTTELTDVTPEVNMINTRCVSMPKVITDSSSPTGMSVPEYSFGSEIVAYVSYYGHDRSWNPVRFDVSTITTFDYSSLADLRDLTYIDAIMSSFRFHPEHSFIGIDASTTPTSFHVPGIPVFGIDNFTTIDYEHVKTLNDVAVLGEFNVPRLAVLK